MNNYSLHSYIHSLYQKNGLTSQDRFFRKLLVVLPQLILDTLKDAFLELLLVLLFLLVILEMEQGKDILVGLFEPNGLYGSVRLVFTTLTLVLYSLTMWIIPAFLLETREQKSNRAGFMFSKHLFFMHRVLALLPLWGFASAIYMQMAPRIMVWCLSLFLLGMLYLLYNHKNFNRYARIRKAALWGCTTASTLLLIYILARYQKSYVWEKYAYSAFLVLLSFVLFSFYYERDVAIIRTINKPAPDHNLFRKYRFNSILYTSLFLLHLLILFLCIWVFDLKGVAPESLLLFIFSYYVSLIDTVYYLLNINRFIKYAVGTSLAILLFAYIYFADWAFNVKHLKLDYKDQSASVFQGSDLQSLEQYYHLWKQRIINRKNKEQPYPIILVSSEGGGSRAGLWFLQTLINLDYVTGGKLKDHIFSLSTVSGSSVGAGALMAYWEYTKGKRVDSFWKNYPGRVFDKNYVSEGILGLTTTDFWKSLIPAVPWKHDRNSELQQEEAICVQLSLEEVYNGKPEREFPFSRKTSIDFNDSNDVKKYYLTRDFLSFYYDRGQLKTDFPLLFLNTCRSDDARRGIFAPVRLDPDDFLDAIDISRFLYVPFFKTKNAFREKDSTVHGLGRAVSLGAACNTSEIFPFFSAPVLIERLGYFVDGGYHDNSGLKTTMEIYRKLEALLAKDSSTIGPGSYKIYILYLKNNLSIKKYYPEKVKFNLPVFQPLGLLTNLPFSGSASYFEEKAQNEGGDSAFIPFRLDYKAFLNTSNSAKFRFYSSNIDTAIQKQVLRDIQVRSKMQEGTADTTINFPLARWLSYVIVERIKQNVEYVYEQDSAIQGIVRNINAAEKSQGLPAGDDRP